MIQQVRWQGDTVRRVLFRAPISWHAQDFDEAWRSEERRISALIDRAVGDYFAYADRAGTRQFPLFPNPNPRYFLLDLMLWCLGTPWRIVRRPISYLVVMCKALAGDRKELVRIGRRFEKISLGCRRYFANLVDGRS